MPVLEVCRRRLHVGITSTDPALLSAFSHIRSTTGAQCSFYTAMEEPGIIFALGLWPSMDVYHAFEHSPEAATILAPLNALSSEEWIEHVPIDKMEELPLTAPIMTISRCFFNESGDHVEKYLEQTNALLPAIEQETKPWPYVGYFTVDSSETLHKRMVFGGWRSKKHHQEFASKLKKECSFFEEMPLHYDPKTQHRHCWDIERETNPGMFEVLEGFVHQLPGQKAVKAQ